MPCVIPSRAGNHAVRDTKPCGISCRAGEPCRAGHEKVSSFDRTRGRAPDARASKGQERRRVGCASETARTIGQSRVVPAIEKNLEPIRVRSEPAALEWDPISRPGPIPLARRREQAAERVTEARRYRRLATVFGARGWASGEPLPIPATQRVASARGGLHALSFCRCRWCVAC